MLDKRRIDLTQSCSRQIHDNALLESKNASLVRKHLGCSHIHPQLPRAGRQRLPERRPDPLASTTTELSFFP